MEEKFVLELTEAEFRALYVCTHTFKELNSMLGITPESDGDDATVMQSFDSVIKKIELLNGENVKQH